MPRKTTQAVEEETVEQDETQDELSGQEVVEAKMREIYDRKAKEETADEDESDETTEAVAEEQEPTKEEFSPAAVNIASAFGIGPDELSQYFKGEEEFLSYASVHAARAVQQGIARDKGEEVEPEEKPIEFSNPFEGSEDVDEAVVKGVGTLVEQVNKFAAEQHAREKELKAQLAQQQQAVQTNTAQEFERQYYSWRDGDDSAKAILKTRADEDRHVQAIADLASVAKSKGQQLPPIGVLAKKALAMEFAEELMSLGTRKLSDEVKKRNGTPMGRPGQNRKFVKDTEALKSFDPKVRLQAVNEAIDNLVKTKKADTGRELEPWEME